MDCCRVLRNVFLKLTRHECMHNVGPIVRDLQIAKTPIELKRMAATAMSREADGHHRSGGIFDCAHHLPRGGIYLRCYRCVRPSLQRIAGSVAIIAGHLNAAILWANQVRLKVQVMVESDLSGVKRVPGNWRELRMLLVKAVNR